jgi:hypothetical protein
LNSLSQSLGEEKDWNMFPYEPAEIEPNKGKSKRNSDPKSGKSFAKKNALEKQLQSALKALQKESELRHSLEIKNKQLAEENELLRRNLKN